MRFQGSLLVLFHRWSHAQVPAARICTTQPHASSHCFPGPFRRLFQGIECSSSSLLLSNPCCIDFLCC